MTMAAGASRTVSSIKYSIAPAVLCLALAACVPGLAGESGPSTVAAPVASEPARPEVPQVPPGTAVMTVGTIAVTGLPFYPDNSIPALYAEYLERASGGDEEWALSAWYARGALPEPEGWRAPVCRAGGSAAPAGTLASPDGVTLFVPGSGYALFVTFPPGYPDPCRLAAVISERFAFFLRYAADQAAVSFPAVLEPGNAAP